MFTRFLSLATVASAAVITAGGAHAAPILVNGGFEGGAHIETHDGETSRVVPDGWIADAPFAAQPDQDAAVFSPFLARTGSGLLIIGGDVIEDGPPATLSQYFNDVSGQFYVVDFWTFSQTAEMTPDPDSMLKVSVGDQYVKATQDSLFQYVEHQFTFKGTGYDQLSLTAATSTGYFVVDDVSVTPLEGAGGVNPGVPEPASWALLILGFGGVGAALRRRHVGAVA